MPLPGKKKITHDVYVNVTPQRSIDISAPQHLDFCRPPPWKKLTTHRGKSSPPTVEKAHPYDGKAQTRIVRYADASRRLNFAGKYDIACLRSGGSNL